MRKIKLMALLLAALMVMSAFAGCANGVEDDVTALEDRVGAIEDKLNNLGDKIDNLGDNQAVLDAIESMGKDLNDKIDDLNGRVDAVENPEQGAITPAAVKAAAEKALASIEVKRAAFIANAAEYTEEDYAKIIEALGVATAAINAAATEADVAAAVAALEATLKNYMTYAMRMYDYYTKLLGNLVDDEDEAMKALVEEIAEFIEVVDELYGNKAAEKLAYEVDEKQDLDVYNSVLALCDIFAGDDGEFEYVDAKGKVKTASLEGLKDYIADAKALVKAIDKAIGDEIVYSATGYGALDKCIGDYRAYVAAAEILGGDALVALVTNSDKLVEAEGVIKNLADAAEAFNDYAGYDATNRKYLSILDKVPSIVALVYEDDGDLAFTAELYAEAAELVADWADEFDLSDANVKAIFAAKGGDYAAFLANARLVEYKMAAYNTFKADVAPAIAALNKSAKTNNDSALKYAEIEDMIKDLVVILVADDENDKIDEALLGANAEILVDEADLVAMAIMAGIFSGDEDEVEAKVDAFTDAVAAADGVKDVVDYSIALYTFNEKTNDALVNFFTVEFKAINVAAKAINDEIAALAKAVKDYNIASVKKFILLSGEYATISMLKDGEEFVAGNGDKLTNATEGAADMYILLSSVDADIIEGALGSGAANVMTIAAFNAAYKGFESLIDTEAFAAAKKALEENVAARFEGANAIVKAVAAIDYVRDGAANTVFYTDVNGNGKYDATIDTLADAPAYKVSLDAKASVAAAKAAYDAWVLEGGREDLEMLVAAVNEDDKSYENVFVFTKLGQSDIKAAINTINALSAEITALQNLADAFVKNVNNVAAADAYSAFVVAKNSNGSYVNVFKAPYSGITNADVIKYYAITKFTASTASKKSVYDGAYTYARDNGSAFFVIDIDDTETSSGTSLAGKLAGITTKKALLNYTVASYDAYVAANLKVVADAANDYTKGDVYYAVKGVAENAAVKTAVDAYAKYDLLYAKGVILNKFATSTDAAAISLMEHAVQATTFAQLVNAINNYNSIVDDKFVSAADFTLIYDIVLADVVA